MRLFVAWYLSSIGNRIVDGLMLLELAAIAFSCAFFIRLG